MQGIVRYRSGKLIHIFISSKPIEEEPFAKKYKQMETMLHTLTTKVEVYEVEVLNLKGTLMLV